MKGDYIIINETKELNIPIMVCEVGFCLYKMFEV